MGKCSRHVSATKSSLSPHLCTLCECRGLGAGISADGFAQHGISTTVVEIDPAVYEAARQYFGLRHLGDDRVFLEDARGWVHKRQSAMQLDEGKILSKFELVVHDCFSGGGVPQHLFSVEFWNDLISIMSPEGVVAVVRRNLKYNMLVNNQVPWTELCRETWLAIVPSRYFHLAEGVRTM
jgi:spermidine synthase